MRLVRVIMVFMVVAIAVAIGAERVWAQPAGGASRPAAESTVGIEGRVIFRHPRGEPVQAVPVNDKAPVVVRIAEASPDGEFVLYDIRFIAQYPGEFDLRDCLRLPDGSPLSEAAALPVVVGQLLPEDHQGELIETGSSRLPRLGGYRLALIVIGVLWLVPPLWWIAKKLMRKSPPLSPPVERPATLADQLRPLVEEAIRGTLSVGERARLELMLLAYWRERLGMAADGLDQAAAIRKLREHAEAGELLTLLERWLHRPPKADEVVDVAAVLERYRGARPVELVGAKAVGA